MTAKKQSTKKGGPRKAGGGRRKLTRAEEARIRAKIDADAEAVHPLALEAYSRAFRVYLNNPDAVKTAARCVEIWDAWKDREGEGANYFREHVDEVMTDAGEGVMVSSPDSDVFTFLFVRTADAYRERPAPNNYTRLLDLIKRVDEGASLDELHDENERRHAERDARRKAAQRRKPEPKDKLSFDWRLWTLRRIEDGMRSESEAEHVEAWGQFWSFYDGFRDTLLGRRDYTPADVGEAVALLPYIVGAWQREQKARKGKGKK